MTAPVVIIPTPRSRWSGGRVYGLGDPLAEARVLDRPLSQWRAGGRALSPQGESLQGPLILCGEDLWVSPRMFGGFWRAASRLKVKAPLRLVRPVDGPGGFCDPLGRLARRDEGRRVAFDLWVVPEGVTVPAWSPEGPLPEALSQARGVDVEARQLSHRIEVDRAVAPEGMMEVSFTHSVAAPVGHWVELARTNLLAIGAQALERPMALGCLALGWAVVRAASVNPFRVMSRLTRRGRGCTIHPTAVVEGCVLGDHVKVDAGAVLRGCIIGDHAQVEAMALAGFTVLGEGARLQRRASANLAVVYPGARIGGMFQLGVAGRGAAFKYGAIAADMNPSGPVRVATPDGLIAVDMGYQGICLGHESFVAANLVIAPGRLIEAKRSVVTESRMVVRS